MGRRHLTCGAKPGHYATVVKALLQTLSECLEKEFTSTMEAAWRPGL
jgi:hemoglobin-like flavoprotein